MAILFLFFFIIRVCTSCSAHMKSRSKVKILEDYVVSANFDRNLALPQLKSTGGHPITAALLRAEQRILNDDGPLERHPYRRDPTYSKAESQLIYQNNGGEKNDLDIYIPDKHEGNVLSERDIAGPPPPAALISAHSLYAIGFITFLILLSSLQASLTIMTKKPGLLGAVTKPLGRRKRMIKDEEFLVDKLKHFC